VDRVAQRAQLDQKPRLLRDGEQLRNLGEGLQRHRSEFARDGDGVGDQPAHLGVVGRRSIERNAPCANAVVSTPAGPATTSSSASKVASSSPSTAAESERCVGRGASGAASQRATTTAAAVATSVGRQAWRSPQRRCARCAGSSRTAAMIAWRCRCQCADALAGGTWRRRAGMSAQGGEDVATSGALGQVMVEARSLGGRNRSGGKVDQRAKFLGGRLVIVFP